MPIIKIPEELVKKFAYDTFRQEFPFKLYISDGQNIQPTSQEWINEYYPEFVKHHPRAKIINLNTQENVDRYINEHLNDYKQLMISLDRDALNTQGYQIEEEA